MKRRENSRRHKHYSHGHGVTIHRGPMADRHGTGWRADAIRLEAANQKVIENPGTPDLRTGGDVTGQLPPG